MMRAGPPGAQSRAPAPECSRHEGLVAEHVEDDDLRGTGPSQTNPPTPQYTAQPVIVSSQERH